MNIRRLQLDDARDLWEDFQELHGSDDRWPGDDHKYWALFDGDEPVAITSAVYRHAKGYVYLSYAIVDPRRAGAGIQRRLIRQRLRWAKSVGAQYAITYTLLHNYPSMANLLRCGFKFAAKPRGWPGVAGDVHYFEKGL
jgi:RimJ/RimL family protein N-acetyltransferase